jgi:hypothetical protein
VTKSDFIFIYFVDSHCCISLFKIQLCIFGESLLLTTSISRKKSSTFEFVTSEYIDESLLVRMNSDPGLRADLDRMSQTAVEERVLSVLKNRPSIDLVCRTIASEILPPVRPVAAAAAAIQNVKGTSRCYYHHCSCCIKICKQLLYQIFLSIMLTYYPH